MTREAGVAYKSIKYELCNLKAKCTNLAKEFTTAVFLDVNRRIIMRKREQVLQSYRSKRSLLKPGTERNDGGTFRPVPPTKIRNCARR